jgi:chemotaxis protein CheZ
MIDTPKMDIVGELSELRTVIQRISVEVAAVRHPFSTEDRLNAAAAELHEVVSTTEGATNGILETAEAIGNLAAELEQAPPDANVGAVAAKIGDLVTALFTHCSFQDLTGQRINKVVTTLRFVDQRIAAIIRELGADSFAELPLPEAPSNDDEKRLLNGPQAEGVSQDDIDRLFP